MKRIIRNYVVRDPKPIMDAILRGVSNYTTITLTPSVDGQLIFDDLGDVIINDIEKTELYVNGVRYIVNLDYTIDGKNLTWLGNFVLKTTFNLVLIIR
jgi:hypothetical protein